MAIKFAYTDFKTCKTYISADLKPLTDRLGVNHNMIIRLLKINDVYICKEYMFCRVTEAIKSRKGHANQYTIGRGFEAHLTRINKAS